MSRLALYAIAASALMIPNASQAVEVPSVYNNSIFAYYPPNGDPGSDPNIGTAFDDWDNIPVAFEDPEDNPGSNDFKTVKLANDENYLYVYIEYYGEPSVNTFVSIDSDMDTATGFNLFSAGIIGSEATWQNDFPISQRNGLYNEGVLYGGPFNNGGAPIYPFYNLNGPEREWMIPLNVTHDEAKTLPVFTQDSFNIFLWTEEGQGDVLGSFFPAFDVLTYTLAEAPSLAGDYNGDGFVNAADYTVWRDSFDAVGADLPADGNGNEVIDNDDYAIWANNYGAGTPVAVGVPEPSSLLLAAMAIGAVARRRSV